MIPNNNLSVLPWYTSLDQQNARKWWVYGRVYPLFTPAGFLLPFQLMRPHRLGIDETYNWEADSSFEGFIALDGQLQAVANDRMVYGYDNSNHEEGIYFNAIPHPVDGGILAVAMDAQNGNVLGTFNPDFPQGETFTGNWKLPAGTEYVYVQHNAGMDDPILAVQYTSDPQPITNFDIYAKDGEYIGAYDPATMGITVVGFESLGYDVIVFPGQLPVLSEMDNGQYYAIMSDGTDTWYSEMFTVVNDIAPYLKLEWWDAENFVMDAGTIVYRNPVFKNVLYLDATIAKPEYVFEEEGENRDGYFFPVKQISEKRYRFAFLASEYLLDVMRFVRMADFAQITKNGQTYSLDTFLITPEWESNGDVASVQAEFDTATVAKKIGTGYIKALRGDFNDDFNNDFDI